MSSASHFAGRPATATNNADSLQQHQASAFQFAQRAHAPFSPAQFMFVGQGGSNLNNLNFHHIAPINTGVFPHANPHTQLLNQMAVDPDSLIVLLTARDATRISDINNNPFIAGGRLSTMQMLNAMAAMHGRSPMNHMVGAFSLAAPAAPFVNQQMDAGVGSTAFLPVGQPVLGQQLLQGPVESTANAVAPSPTNQETVTTTKKKSDDKNSPPRKSSTAEDAHILKRQKRIYRHESFVEKLYRLLIDLESEGKEYIASFTPSGEGFFVHEPVEFVRDIVPKYFRHRKMSSFHRQLLLYKFERVREGPDRGSFEHKLFKRGRADLLKHIERDDKNDKLPIGFQKLEESG